MAETLRKIFVTRHSELRVPWRLLLFLVLASLGLLLWYALAGTFSWYHVEAEAVAYVLAIGGATYFMVRVVNRKPFKAVGLDWSRGGRREFGLGCLFGVLMMAGIFIIEQELGYASTTSRGLTVLESVFVLLRGAAYFAIAALVEELLFRGYPFQTLMHGVTFLPAMLLFSAVFAAAHAENPHITTLAFINIGLAGVWLSFAYLKTRTLWLPLGLHFSWNFSQTVLFSFPTSGLDMSGRNLFITTQRGPIWVTGGEFGPEGGLLATAAIVLCAGFILKSSLVRRREAVVTLDSIEDLLPGGNGKGQKR
jgi:hypothetical protein